MMLRRLSLAQVLCFFSLLLVATAVSSVTVGPMNISANDTFHSLLNLGDLPAHIDIVIREIRLPRTLLCMLVGAILALCGVVMQGLFRNPLAEPGIIGVSAGAALGGAVAIVGLSQVSHLYPQLMNLAILPLFSFLGGAGATWLVYRIGASEFGTSATIMLLAGVAISAISGAVIGYLNFLADDQTLRDLSLWSMGSLAAASWSSIMLALVTMLILYGYFARKAMPLNALLLGEAEARHLGIDVQSLKRGLITLAAVGVGVTVSICGAVGFIGLVIPHLGRMLAGPDHRKLIPISAMLGALLLTAADMVARIAVAPAELPVGIVTAAIGAPFFIYLLLQQKGKML
ncbi:FecCD family ABC transporter permease [Vibrio navarrensis]|uniref:Iron ABC transporter permease n=1 Tax=Vibrio navarrensis TaxID=29495 RepID=A0A099LV92_9VIBR|nr:iron ABC transporter permease [Vibrio navarrensis]